MIKERNLVTAIVLSLVTCGIYSIIWFIGLTDDAKTAANDTQLASGGTAFLLTVKTPCEILDSEPKTISLILM